MFFAPEDPALLRRMHEAFAEATAQLGCSPETEPPTAWGHNGRTLGAPVTHGSSRAWLRVLETPAGKEGGKLWTGTEQAATVLPAEVPRPRLLRSAGWVRGKHAYRGELSSYVVAPTCSRTPDLTVRITVPDAWWARLRAVSDMIIETSPPGGREPVITQDYLHRAIPRFIGEHGIETTVRRWSLAHGDFHWANLTCPELTVLDWEGFGPAPYGFDAAHLHAYTLQVPELAARVRATFSDVLSTPDGWFAEITVAAILLQAAERDPIHARLAPYIRTHARHLLDSQIAPGRRR